MLCLNGMAITFRQLQIFQSVGSHLSVSKAADELFLTQPAVSMQLRQLERSLASRLYVQRGKKIQLTEAGKLALKLSTSVRNDLNAFSDEINNLKSIDGGLLKVSVGITVNYIAARMLSKFCQKYPHIRINFDVSNRATLIKKLEKNETDLVLMGLPPEDVEFNVERFMQNPLVIIAPADHPLVNEKNIPLSKLKNDILLMREIGSGTRMIIEQFFIDQKNFKVISTIEMNSIEAIKQSVSTGLGLGIVSLHTVKLECATDRLKILDVIGFPINMQWYIVSHKGKRFSVAATCFKEYILKNSR